MSKKEKVLKWLGFARLLLPTGLIAAGVDPAKVHQVTELVINAETALGDHATGPEKLASVVKGVTNGMQIKGIAPDTIAATKKMLETGVSSAVTLVNDVHALHEAHASDMAKAAIEEAKDKTVEAVKDTIDTVAADVAADTITDTGAAPSDPI